MTFKMVRGLDLTISLTVGKVTSPPELLFGIVNHQFLCNYVWLEDRKICPNFMDTQNKHVSHNGEQHTY